MTLTTRMHLVSIAAAAAFAANLPSCSPALNRQVAKSAIDVALAACISEHADVQDEPALREICKWTDELAPLVKDLLSARQKGLAAASRKGACGPAPDAGVK